MLKVLFQLILLLSIFRLLAFIFRGSSGLFGRPSPKTRTGRTSQKKPKSNSDRPDYSKLSSYEIEDIDYEEIKKKKESH